MTDREKMFWVLGSSRGDKKYLNKGLRLTGMSESKYTDLLNQCLKETVNLFPNSENK